MEKFINWKTSIQEGRSMSSRNSLCLMGSPETTSGTVRENDDKCCMINFDIFGKFDIIIIQML